MIYTATPPVFDLVALVTEHPGREPLRQLPLTSVVRGHFEQGGELIIEDTALAIKRVVHFREFFLNGPKLRDQHYLLFGRSGDVLLSHLLSAPPDFDQFLAVEFKANDVPSEAVGKRIESLLAQGLYLHLPDRENGIATRLRAGDVLTCSLETGTRALPITVELRATDQTLLRGRRVHEARIEPVQPVSALRRLRPSHRERCLTVAQGQRMRSTGSVRGVSPDILWRGLTSPVRASPATALRLPRCGPAREALVGREISRFPRKERPCMPGSLTTPGRRALALTRPFVWPSVTVTTSAPGTIALSRLNGRPARSPADASPGPSQGPTHGSGPVWLARPSL